MAQYVWLLEISLVSATLGAVVCILLLLTVNELQLGVYFGFWFALFLNKWRMAYQGQPESHYSWRIKDSHQWERQLCGSSHLISHQNYYQCSCWVSSSPGIIEHRDQPHSAIRYFTQEDINQGKIMYRPPAAAPHLQEIMAFSFAGNAFLSVWRHLNCSLWIFMAGCP